MPLSWGTLMNVSGDFDTEWIGNIPYTSLMAAIAELVRLLNLEFLGNLLTID